MPKRVVIRRKIAVRRRKREETAVEAPPPLLGPDLSCEALEKVTDLLVEIGAGAFAVKQVDDPRTGKYTADAFDKTPLA